MGVFVTSAAHPGQIVVGKRLKAGFGCNDYALPVSTLLWNAMLLRHTLQGGHLEFGEDFITCAVREVEEECGVSLTDLRVMPYTANSYSSEHGCHYVTIFVHGQTSQEPVNTEPHKCESWLWCSVGDIPTPRFQPLQLFLDAKVSLF